MMKKQGITVSMLVIVIAVLAILTTVVVTSVSTSIDNTNFTIWTQEISLVQETIKEVKVDIDDYLLETIEFDTKDIPATILSTQFNGENITSGKITLYQINVTKLGLENLSYGNYENINDVYTYSKETGKVYYLKGMTLSNNTYYTLTAELANKYDELNETSGVLSTIVFTPSSVSYTNVPVTVTVNVPKMYTEIKITTSNSNVVVGTQVVEASKYTYLVNTSNYAGNYTINVKYNDGEVKNIQYVVDIFDNQSPTITNINIEDYVVTVDATDDKAGVKEIRYILADMPNENVQEYFRTKGIKVDKQKFKLNTTAVPIILYVEDKAGNYTVQELNSLIIPEDWKESVREVTLDEVPIPIGFVKSPYPNEGEKSKGLVIYALTEQEIEDGVTDITKKDATQQYSLENRNQFIWVSVDSDDFMSEFIRQTYNKYSINTEELGTNYWEAILDNTTNMPISTQSTTYMSDKTSLEVKEMYESVKKYGGFYIARYETGKDGEGNISVTMGKYPYNDISWSSSNTMNVDSGGAISQSRNFYSKDAANYGVVSTLIYGVQWDRTLMWCKEMQSKLNITESTSYGNYSNRVINSDSFELNAQYAIYDEDTKTFSEWQTVQATTTKTSLDKWLITTGGVKNNKICNIYDMAGNLYEWTMEGKGSTERVLRGGSLVNSGASNGTPVLTRGSAMSTYMGQRKVYGFRISLYIK